MMNHQESLTSRLSTDSNQPGAAGFRQRLVVFFENKIFDYFILDYQSSSPMLWDVYLRVLEEQGKF